MSAPGAASSGSAVGTRATTTTTEAQSGDKRKTVAPATSWLEAAEDKKKPKKRDFKGDAQLPEALKVELEEFFRPHRTRFAELLRDRKIKMTRLTDASKAVYVA